MRTQSQPCPACRRIVDATTSVTEKGVKPCEGDYLVCVYCGAMLRFSEDQSLRLADDHELKELMRLEPQFFRLLIISSQMLNKARRV